MQSFKAYIKEQQIIDNYVIENLSFELYCSLLDGKPISTLCEDIGDDARRRGLEYQGFGRWGNDGEVKFKSDNGKLIPFTPSDDHKQISNVPEKEKASLDNISQKLKSHVDNISNDLSASRDSVVAAFKQPTAYRFMKSIGFGLEKAGQAALKGLQTLNVVMKSTFEELHKTGVLKKLENGAIKVDDVLNRYPTMKKIGGVAIAGFLVYQWQHMAFSGDLDDDFDISSIASAMAGSYTIKDVFASPQGLKGLTQLATGIATGVTFPWGKIGPATLAMAALYTGAKQAGNTTLAKKAMEKFKAA